MNEVAIGTYIFLGFVFIGLPLLLIINGRKKMNESVIVDKAICQGVLTRGNAHCTHDADLRCRGCGFSVCYLHSNYVCECPVSMAERRGLEIKS